VTRVPVEVLTRCHLNDTARIHDGDVVGQFKQEREVMGDKDHREVQFLAQAHDLSQDFTLYNHIKRGGRFVHYENFGGERESYSNDGPLAHAAAQFVRIAAQAIRSDADQFKQFPCALLA